MSTFVQICIGVIALTQVAFVAVSIIVAARLKRAVDDASRAIDLVDGLIKDAARTSAEVRKVAGGLDEVTYRLRSLATRFERVGNQAASISSMVLDEVEAPVRTATAWVRGVRKGAGVVIDRITGRKNAATSGG